MLRTYWKDLEKILGRCRELGLILVTSSEDLVDISCPKLLEIRARKKPIGSKTRTLDIEVEVDGRSRSRNKPPIVPQRGTAYSKRFLLFWETYPRKVGKKAAFNAWQRAKINGKIDDILKAVETQKTSEQWTKEGGQFIPNPATWLNQGRWEDEQQKSALEKWAEE
jgi:hypothetical protein